MEVATERLLEISDLIVDFDPERLERRPVRKQAVIEQFQAVGDSYAARIVAGLPEEDGVLCPHAVDRLLVRVHCEMQRLSEEFQHGQRVYELLRPLLKALREGGARSPLRIVDLGCGTGYVIRWLAAYGEFESDVELLGVDFNRALIDEAARLAEAENLVCRFQVANAFRLRDPATVILSTGVVHHFRGLALQRFFQQHDQEPTLAFAHFDFQPNLFAWPGAWLFHYIRMREPLSHHDGVISARRAHSAKALLRVAPPGFQCGIYSARLGATPLLRVFHTLIGVRPPFAESFSRALGPRLDRWDPRK